MTVELTALEERIKRLERCMGIMQTILYGNTKHIILLMTEEEAEIPSMVSIHRDHKTLTQEMKEIPWEKIRNPK